MLTPIPAPSAFAMFFENNYLSQPHKHSGPRTEDDLYELARRDWYSEEPANVQIRAMYEAQAQKQRLRYQESSQGFETAAVAAGPATVEEQGRRQHGRSPRTTMKLEREANSAAEDGKESRKVQRKRRDGDEDGDVEMGGAEAERGAAGGFTSING